MENRAVHREMKKGEMESENEGKERDEKDKIMWENIEWERKGRCVETSKQGSNMSLNQSEYSTVCGRMVQN